MWGLCALCFWGWCNIVFGLVVWVVSCFGVFGGGVWWFCFGFPGLSIGAVFVGFHLGWVGFVSGVWTHFGTWGVLVFTNGCGLCAPEVMFL